MQKKIKKSKNICDISEDFENLINKKKKKSKIFKCKYCDKEFKHQSSYCRHVKHRCKMKGVVKEVVKEEEKEYSYKPKIEEPEEIFHTTNTYDKIGGTTINNVYNTTVNNIQNIGTQNIIINNYGMEDISYITSEKMLLIKHHLLQFKEQDDSFQ